MFSHQDREQNTKKIKLPVMYFIVKPGAKSRPPGGKNSRLPVNEKLADMIESITMIFTILNNKLFALFYTCFVLNHKTVVTFCYKIKCLLNHQKMKPEILLKCRLQNVCVQQNVSCLSMVWGSCSFERPKFCFSFFYYMKRHDKDLDKLGWTLIKVSEFCLLNGHTLHVIMQSTLIQWR